MPKRATEWCSNCRWGEFTMTKHSPPRINPAVYGECRYSLPPLPLVPLCVEVKYLNKEVIWSSYTGCPVWAAKEKVGT